MYINIYYYFVDCLKVLEPDEEDKPSDHSTVNLPLATNDAATVTSQQSSVVPDVDDVPVTTASSNNS